MAMALPYTGRLRDFMAQDAAAKKLGIEYERFARSIGCGSIHDELIVTSQWQMDQLTKWWQENTNGL